MYGKFSVRLPSFSGRFIGTVSGNASDFPDDVTSIIFGVCAKDRGVLYIVFDIYGFTMT